MKFKVGDKVRFIGRANDHHIHGETMDSFIEKHNNTFTIAYINTHDNGDIAYIEFEEDRTWCIHSYEIELIEEEKEMKFKVGDIIKRN